MMPEADSGGLEHIGLKPLVQKISGAHGHQFESAYSARRKKELRKRCRQEVKLLEITRFESRGIRAESSIAAASRSGTSASSFSKIRRRLRRPRANGGESRAACARGHSYARGDCYQAWA